MRRFLVLTLALAATAYPSFASEYAVRDLGTLGLTSEAHDVNDSGQVVGLSIVPDDVHIGGVAHAFIWSEADGMRDIGTLGGYNSRAFGINNLGMVVGDSDTVGTPRTTAGFFWKQGSTMGRLPGLESTGAYAKSINDQGQIVGSSGSRAVLWQGNNVEELALPCAADSSFANCISSDGHVAGYLTANGHAYPFVTYHGSSSRPLGTEPGTANGINAWCQIVGRLTARQRAYIWSADDGLQILGVLAGCDTSEAYAVNDLGQVVGTSSLLSTGEHGHAFVWDPVEGMQDLGVLPGCQWSIAFGINNRGDIVGVSGGRDVGGHAVMWSPTPAPAAVPIARARQLPPYSCVRLDDAVVTATNLSGSAFVESIDRTAGVRLLTNQSLAVGQRVGLRGIVTRQSGEYLVRNVVFHSTADGDPLAPLGMTTKTIGNDRTETLSYIGQNTTGLLVRVAGKVTGVVSAQRVIYLDDGYNYQDGMLPGLGIFGIRVYIPEGLTLPTKGKRLVVTGISRVEQFTLTQWSEVNGMVWGPGTVLYVPSIWPRDAADIRLLN